KVGSEPSYITNHCYCLIFPTEEYTCPVWEQSIWGSCAPLCLPQGALAAGATPPVALSCTCPCPNPTPSFTAGASICPTPSLPTSLPFSPHRLTSRMLLSKLRAAHVHVAFIGKIIGHISQKSQLLITSILLLFVLIQYELMY
uniref:Uncharacterized protein n=1 Tax=Crocodylus porosus TaxID=8502 RepID=A0A7M4ESG1_CROPO